jgi:hypothetical protein
MWPFGKGNEDRAASVPAAAERLIDITGEAVPALASKLLGEVASDKEQLLSAIMVETTTLGLHLTDRIAFERLGAERRTMFMNALLPLVNEKLQPLAGSLFHVTYNARNTFYGSCRKLFPEKGENLQGTLFWEFGKTMASVCSRNNPAAVTKATAFAMSYFQTIVAAYEQANIFS